MRIKVLSGGRKSIELPLSEAELNFQMKRIGIEETVPVCRLVEASEKDNPLSKFEGQTVNMDEVKFFAKRLESLSEYERKVLYSYVTDYGVGTIQDLINLTFSMKGLSLITDFSDAEQVGKRLYLDEFIVYYQRYPSKGIWHFREPEEKISGKRNAQRGIKPYYRGRWKGMI